MRYVLKLWGSCAYVTKKRFVYAWLTFSVPKSMNLFIDGAEIIAPDLRELAWFVKDLPEQVDILKLRKNNKNKVGNPEPWCLGANKLSLLSHEANVEGIITQFTRLFGEIEPLLELAEVICEQTCRRPLQTDTSVRFIGCGKINGMSIEEWLNVRKEAGAKIDPSTAEVRWIYAQTLDPY